MPPNVLVVIGTRPELIKLAPLILELKVRRKISPVILFTGQHKDLTDSLWNLFEITPDVSIEMSKDRNLNVLISQVFSKFQKVVDISRPTFTIVQGDTSSAVATALASYNLKIPVVHVEAGLRTYDLMYPWPEEGNRRILDSISSILFAPTAGSKRNLLNEKVTGKVFLSGNTIVDAVKLIQSSSKYRSIPTPRGKYIIWTMHRREIQGKVMADLFQAMKCLATMHRGYRWIVPLHPNPGVRSSFETGTEGTLPCNVNIVKPMPYDMFLAYMAKARLIVTDSGGIQEEVITLGTKTMVVRQNTERLEGLDLDTVDLIGVGADTVVRAISKELKDFPEHDLDPSDVYGDGRAANRIVSVLEAEIGLSSVFPSEWGRA